MKLRGLLLIGMALALAVGCAKRQQDGERVARDRERDNEQRAFADQLARLAQENETARQSLQADLQRLAGEKETGRVQAAQDLQRLAQTVQELKQQLEDFKHQLTTQAATLQTLATDLKSTQTQLQARDAELAALRARRVASEDELIVAKLDFTTLKVCAMQGVACMARSGELPKAEALAAFLGKSLHGDEEVGRLKALIAAERAATPTQP